MSKENVEIVRRLYDAVARRDTETVFSLYDPEVVIDGSRHRWGEVIAGDSVWRGHDGVREFSRGYFGDWENLEDEIDEVIEAGDRVVTIVTTRARGGARAGSRSSGAAAARAVVRLPLRLIAST